MITFPKDFIWGSATSSYQIEGAWLEGGKGLSIWDAFAHTPDKVHNGETGDVACDHYHRYKEDVALMAAMGVKAYRFSISWPRIRPAGYGPVNPEGIRFYSNLIDELLAHGIVPWVTLYHWDLPLALQLEHDGWLNPKIADLFRDYAGVCFDYFGDRVKNWITFNEPWVVATEGYGKGTFAPGRISRDEPYQIAHQMLRAHGLAVDLYRIKYAHQSGRIGMTNNCDWREPRTGSKKDREAAQRAVEFFLGWFGDPLYFGKYPDIMAERVRERLPEFSDRDRGLIKGSSDFFGLNHYSTRYVADASGRASGGAADDQEIVLSNDPAWDTTAMGWAIVPWGINRLLHWIDNRYSRPEIVITENGCALDDRLVDGIVNDRGRIEYFEAYLRECHKAIAAGVKLKGYFAWSFIDNFEWASGYSKRFGLHYVDFASSKRIAKASAAWFRQVMENNGF